jgi:hypothetical protein
MSAGRWGGLYTVTVMYKLTHGLQTYAQEIKCLFSEYFGYFIVAVLI